MTTTPTASPELPDLDKLEALARAATPGRWMRLFGERTVYDRMEDGCRGNAIVRADLGYGLQDISNLDFIAAASPAAVLALIALARRAQPEGEAQQAAPLREVQIDRIARAYFSEQWAVQHAKDAIHDAFEDARKSASLSPLCGAQHAESGALDEEDAKLVARGMERLRKGIAGECRLPPVGWQCTRADGHEGPCAAHPVVAQQAAAPGALAKSVPMCEGCDNAATLHADGTTGLCHECLADDHGAPGTPEAPKGGV